MSQELFIKELCDKMKSKKVNVSKQYKIRQHRPNLEETLQAKFDDTDDDNVD